MSFKSIKQVGKVFKPYKDFDTIEQARMHFESLGHIDAWETSWNRTEVLIGKMHFFINHTDPATFRPLVAKH